MPGAHVPIEIKLHQKSRVMEISFSDGSSYRLPYEFLRVYSPSAEVRGHGPGQEVLQTGKREVEIRVRADRLEHANLDLAFAGLEHLLPRPVAAHLCRRGVHAQELVRQPVAAAVDRESVV